MLGRVVNPVVDVLDVDGIVQRIDMNEVLEKVDWDRLLDRIDLDRVLDRVDVNRHLDRIDVQDLVDRAQIGAIVARGTSGICGPLLDGMRAQIVILDRFVQGTGWIRANTVPPAPARIEPKLDKIPRGTVNIAVALQGRYAGTFSRGLAFLVDQLVTSSTFFIVLLLIDRAAEVITQREITVYELSYNSLSLRILYITWVFIYHASALAASSRTPGKVVLGLLVVNNKTAKHIDTKTAILRALVVYPCVWIIIGVLVGLYRQDRRELQDLISGTAVVYSWDAQYQKYRSEEDDEDESSQSESSEATNNSVAAPAKFRFNLFQRRTTRKPKGNDEETQEPPQTADPFMAGHLDN